MATRRPPAHTSDDLHPDTPHAEQPGERRAIWLITRVESLQDDPDAAIDARELLGGLPVLAQRYLALILGEGPKSNAEAAAALNTTADKLEPSIRALEEVVNELAGGRG